MQTIRTVLKGQVNVSQAEFERIALAQVRDRTYTVYACNLHDLGSED